MPSGPGHLLLKGRIAEEAQHEGHGSRQLLPQLLGISVGRLGAGGERLFNQRLVLEGEGPADQRRLRQGFEESSRTPRAPDASRPESSAEPVNAALILEGNADIVDGDFLAALVPGQLEADIGVDPNDAEAGQQL